jgi:hypothetical protein
VSSRPARQERKQANSLQQLLVAVMGNNVRIQLATRHGKYAKQNKAKRKAKFSLKWYFQFSRYKHSQI